MWKGWATLEMAPMYEQLFTQKVLPTVTRGVKGYLRSNLLRREVDGEVEFTTIFWFESVDAVRQFAGDHFDRAVVPEEVRAILHRFEDTVHHYETVL